MVDLRPYRNLDAIVLIRQLIRSWWGLELTFADARGDTLDASEGVVVPPDNEFCRLSLFSHEGYRRCNNSFKAVRDRLCGSRGSPRSRGEDRSPVLHQCHLGFDIAAAPIYIDDALAGFLFTKGGHHRDLTDAEASELLRKVREFASPDAINSVDAVNRHLAGAPQLSETDLRHLADLLQRGATEIAKYHAERSADCTGRSSDRDVGEHFAEIVGNAPAMRDLYHLLEKIVQSESTVLIHGESGTGKELIARAIHYHGPRAKKPFVVQNCSAFNDNLLESALFGHTRGAFTGAVKDQKGLFEVADNGTFFLDEIGDMSPALQVKLLRVLQEGTFTPLGASKQVKVDVRMIAASHKNLAEMVQRGEFREDLYYRINVLRISVPPLRDRIEDVPVLIGHFLRKHSRSGSQGEPTGGEDRGGEVPRLTHQAIEALRAYRWPGNIRELENELERLVVLGTGQAELGVELLSPRIRQAIDNPAVRAAERVPRQAGTLRQAIERFEAEVIGQGLIRTQWNKSRLARELGISRASLNQKCNEYGLDRKES